VTAIATRKQALARTAEPFPMSTALAAAVRQALNPHPDAGADPVPAIVREAAGRALVAMDSMAQPATIEDWLRFLRPVVAVVANPPDREALPGRAAAIAFAFQDVPAAMLDADAQRAIMRSCRYFPTPAELTPIFAPRVVELRSRRFALSRIAATRAPEAQASVPAAARAELAARLSVRAGEMRASASQREAAEREEAAIRRAPQRRIEDPDTPEHELRKAAASGKPGAALARMRLAIMDARRAAVGGARGDE